ncbi:MAG: HAMP domain-containing protein [Proteobacteria bacterium]|nr:HAMP domain-containing protein [Pseudomonadota bacterium]
MRSLYLRIYVTVLVALALFALVSGWLVQRHLEQERTRFETSARDRAEAWADLLQRSLPAADAPPAEQEQAVRDWSQRLRLPLALDDAKGQRVATSESYARREAEAGPLFQRRQQAVRMDDGRTLWLLRLPRGGQPPGVLRPGMTAGPLGVGTPPQGWLPPGLPDGVALALLLLLLFAAVAGGAWPVVRRLTRRLEALKSGVEAFGAGALHQRVSEDGRDEVAALGASFNRAAGRIEALLQTHKSLLANASHELRSPLTRLKMAVSMLEDATAEQRRQLRHEIDVNVGELDALVEEVLLASRLDAAAALDRHEELDLLGLAAEEAARVGANVQGQPLMLQGDERLIRRALRNLLENARRYGGSEIDLGVQRHGGQVEVQVCDRGAGVPEAYREHVFEPFFRLPGHAERAGGVGLGLALVRQIAERHGGSVRCEPRDGGGSCFTLALPAPPNPAPSARA